MLACVGETVSFHVDTGRFGASDALRFAWTVAGARLVDQQGALIRVAMPDEAEFVTVSVEVQHDGRAVGFGTRTLLPLSRDEALPLEILINMREMVMAGEPSNPLVSPTYDPVDRNWLLFSIRVPWMRERARRMQDAAARLLELRKSRGGDPKA
jgi:hypothetical protein